MSIAGVGSAGGFFQSAASRAAQAAAAEDPSQASGAASQTANASDPAVQNFLKYANETPAQRLEDQWLQAHGLTEQELNQMPPDKQAEIRKEMAADIKKELEEQIHKKTGADPTNITVPAGSLADIVV